jgi:hypothetical protein
VNFVSSQILYLNSHLLRVRLPDYVAMCKLYIIMIIIIIIIVIIIIIMRNV